MACCLYRAKLWTPREQLGARAIVLPTCTSIVAWFHQPWSLIAFIWLNSQCSPVPLKSILHRSYMSAREARMSRGNDAKRAGRLEHNSIAASKYQWVKDTNEWEIRTKHVQNTTTVESKETHSVWLQHHHRSWPKSTQSVACQGAITCPNHILAWLKLVISPEPGPLIPASRKKCPGGSRPIVCGGKTRP